MRGLETRPQIRVTWVEGTGVGDRGVPLLMSRVGGLGVTAVPSTALQGLPGPKGLGTRSQVPAQPQAGLPDRGVAPLAQGGLLPQTVRGGGGR